MHTKNTIISLAIATLALALFLDRQKIIDQLTGPKNNPAINQKDLREDTSVKELLIAGADPEKVAALRKNPALVVGSDMANGIVSASATPSPQQTQHTLRGWPKPSNELNLSTTATPAENGKGLGK